LAISAFVLTLIFCLGILKFFPKWGLMDNPAKERYSRKAVPFSAGLAFVLTFFILTLSSVHVDLKLLSVLAGALIIVVMSFVDDRKSIKAIWRLLLQLIGASVPVLVGGVLIDHIHNPLTNSDFTLMIGNFQLAGQSLGIVAVVVTVIWIVALINIMNWVDGLNGLPSGVAGIASLTFFFLSIANFNAIDQSPVAAMSIILFGSLAAFWLFDFYPAKLLMGDTGSMFLGFILAILAIYSGAKIGTAILVLGFPILDAIWVIMRRILAGRSPLKGDYYHFHHRLIYFGLSYRKALLLIYGICLFFGVVSLLSGGWKFWVLILLLVAMALIGFWVSIKEGDSQIGEIRHHKKD